jgi:glycosyltransferase involved in cell wall biosynthesis
MSLPGAHLAGGPATHLPFLRAGLEAEGVKIISFNYTRRKDQESKFEKLYGRGLDLLRLSFLSLRYRPDLIHHNSAFDPGSLVRDGILCVVSRFLRIPVFIKVHGSHREAFGDIGGLKRFMRQRIVTLSTGLGVLSDAEKQEFINRWPHLEDRVHVVKNIVRDEFMSAQVQDHRREMVFFTSRFIKEKGMFDLLHAIPAILAALPQCLFKFIGGGPDSALFAEKVKSLGLHDAVEYLPNKTFAELIDLYRSGGVFVFPTHYPEGMPMALIEAMAVGLLAISSPVRFIQGVSSFATFPFLVLTGPGERSEKIARSLIQVVGDHRLREHVGNLNKSFVKQYSRRLVAHEFVALYNKMLSRR